MTNSLLKPKKVLQEFSTSLPPVYFTLLLINSPVIIMLCVQQILIPNSLTTWTNFRPLTLYFLLTLIYYFCLFPYLQGVSILYIYHYSKKRKPKLLAMFEVAFRRLGELVLGHFLVLFRIVIISTMAFAILLVLMLIGIFLMFTIPPLGVLFIPLVVGGGFLIAIYYSSKFILIPHLIVIKKCSAGDSFIKNSQLTKNHETRIFLFVLIGVILNSVLFYIGSSFSEIIGTTVLFLYQPLLLVYYVVIYKLLKKNLDR